MQDEHSLDETRRRIQESLAQAKRDQLRDEFGMEVEHTDSRLSLEAENQWLDYILEFERQFENTLVITVRERIGDPPLSRVDEIPPYMLEEAIDDLLDLLAEHGVAVDFLGEWDDRAAYRYMTEELLDEEMDDIRIEGMFAQFTATTLEYDVEMWAQHFVENVFWHERDYFLPGLEKQSRFDAAGEPIAFTEFAQKLEALWLQLPETDQVGVRPITTQVVEDEGAVTAVVTWHDGNEQKQVESFFRLQPSPYFGWDVVQTSLLDDLLTIVG